MNRLLPIVFSLLTATAVAQNRRPAPPAQPIQLQNELSGLLADVAMLEGRVQNLQGDFRTMKEISARLKSMRHKLTRLIRAAPQVVQPQVIVTLGSPTQPTLIVQEPRLPPPLPPATEPTPQAMSAADFGRLLGAVKKESFAKGKLAVVSSAAQDNSFTVAQVASLVGTLSFAKDKLACVRTLKRTILDMNNAYQLYDAFTFSKDKEQLKAILGR